LDENILNNVVHHFDHDIRVHDGMVFVHEGVNILNNVEHHFDHDNRVHDGMVFVHGSH
jgi:hypothetical protein